VDHLAQEPKEYLVGDAQQVEAIVGKHPIVVPILRVYHAMTPDISRHVFVPAVARRKAAQVKEPGEEVDVV
jgi:hypothetical protein